MLDSLYGKDDFVELVWENGQIVVRGDSSNRTQSSGAPPPNYMGHSSSINPSLSTAEEGTDNITERTRLLGGTVYSSKPKINSNNKLQQEESANLLRSSVKEHYSKPPTTGGNTHHQLPTYSSTQQCLLPHKKPRIMDSNLLAQAPTTTRSKTHTKVNFPNFLAPALFLKSASSNQGNTANHPTTRNRASSQRAEEIGGSNNKVEKTGSKGGHDHYSVVIESANNNDNNYDKGSQEPKRFQHQTLSLTANNKSKLVGRADEVQPVDEHSEAAVGNYHHHDHHNNADLCKGPFQPSSSMSSLGASNQPNISIRTHEDTIDDTTYLSDDDEETEDTAKETPPREGTRVKRSRNAEIHNLSERKRREKFNKKIRALKELIPNCNKMDKASMLDDAIDYLKTLKLQLQIMSMGSGLYMPFMMPQLMGGGGMCFRPPQFPIPPPLSAITDTTTLHNMFGFNNQMRPIPPISSHQAPFIPPIMPTSTATNVAEQLAKSATLQVPTPNNSEILNNLQQATNQASLHHSTSYPFYFSTMKDEKRDNNGQEGKNGTM